MNLNVIKSLSASVSTNTPRRIKKLDESEFFDIRGEGNNSVCLTFDDGPDPIYTPKILDILAEFNAKATFFVLGESAIKWPNLIERIVRDGHALGNHTYSHRHPWRITSEQAKYEVTYASTIIKDITGNLPRWFRPPFGRLRKVMLNQAEMQKMITVLWSRSVIDWGPLGTEVGIAKRLLRAKSGDIILMHDARNVHNHPNIILNCLPGFLRSLSKTNLVARSLDEVFT